MWSCSRPLPCCRGGAPDNRRVERVVGHRHVLRPGRRRARNARRPPTSGSRSNACLRRPGIGLDPIDPSARVVGPDDSGLGLPAARDPSHDGLARHHRGPCHHVAPPTQCSNHGRYDPGHYPACTADIKSFVRNQPLLPSATTDYHFHVNHLDDHRGHRRSSARGAIDAAPDDQRHQRPCEPAAGRPVRSWVRGRATDHAWSVRHDPIRSRSGRSAGRVLASNRGLEP